MKPNDPRHGSVRGYYAHKRSGTVTCQPCKTARAQQSAEHRRRHPRYCKDCGVQVSAHATRCRDCSWSVSRNSPKRAANLAAKRAADRAVRDDELAYNGGWVRSGLILRPAVVRPEEDAA